MIMSYADLFKGLIIGIIVGGVIVLLAHMGIIPIPLP